MEKQEKNVHYSITKYFAQMKENLVVFVQRNQIKTDNQPN